MNHSNDTDIICDKCQLAPVKTKVKLMYQGIKFDVELLRCPQCGQTFIPEDLALKKIHEVEITLEDK